MRWVIPTGIIRANHYCKPSPALAKLRAEGCMALNQTPKALINALYKTVLMQIGHHEITNNLDTYSQWLTSKGVQREIILTTKGEADCPLAKLARNQDFIDMACNFLAIPKKNLIIDAVVDILNPLPTPTRGYDALSFHRDIDAYRFLKIFIYLKDCRVGEGHHEYILNTHNIFPADLIELRSYTQEEIINAIPSATIVKMVGDAGFTFAENTIGFHRGTLPTSEYRLMATIIYMEDRFKAIYPDHFMA